MGMFGNPLVFVTRLFIIFTLMPIHEFAHAYVADKLGDPTARNMGRLTLNPLAHVDMIGGLMLVLTGFGFAKPVQVNAGNFINPKRGMAVVAAAGPISNIIVSFILLIIIKLMALLGYYTGLSYTGFFVFLMHFIMLLCSINLSLAVFNLLPVPPLDGSKVIGLFLPDKLYYKFAEYERYLSIILFALIYIGILDRPINWLSGALYNLLDLLTFFIPNMIGYQ